MYREYRPDIRLQHLIEAYWFADEIIGSCFHQQIMPDGCVDILFDFQQNNSTGRFNYGIPGLVGTCTSSFEFTYDPGHVQMMGIRFAPGGITAFTRIPVYEITNEHIELPLAETLLDDDFYKRLPDMKSMDERITYINHYFISRLNKFYLPDEQIQYAVAIARNAWGQLPVKQLAEEVCMSERNFERKFKTAIGTSPKLFSNVTRFQYARRYVRAHRDESLYSVAIACGYHDHSHMNKEFQRLGNLSPSDLI